MSLDDINNFKNAWVAALKRSLAAGIDVVEIHNGHGYIFHQFMSPATNQRTDKYGGSFENRIRLTMEIVDLTRINIPQDMPLFLRLSSSDCLDHDGYDGESWTLKDSVKLAEILAVRGVDLLDVTSAGNHPAQNIHVSPGYQAPAAKAIKEAVGDKMAIGVVGMITSGKQANGFLEQGLDFAVSGRGFLKNPGLVWAWAEELGVEVNVANQIRWGFGGRPGALQK
jgi:2,4-dienoyl-CoA reductase-like NADH-dependent reductase (Old Yellow Enzyme family)